MLLVSLMFWKGDDDDEDDDEEEDDDDSLLRGPAFLFSLGGLHRRYVRVPQSRWRRSGSCVRLMSVFRVACACFTSMATVRGLHFMAYISFFCILMSPLAGATLKNSPRAVPFVHEAAAGEGK